MSETIDLEQIRRDAEWMIDACSNAPDGAGAILAHACLDLLDELKQSEARVHAEQTIREVSDRERDKAQDRVAKMSALVKQVRKSVDEWNTGSTPMKDLADALERYDSGAGG